LFIYFVCLFIYNHGLVSYAVNAYHWLRETREKRTKLQRSYPIPQISGFAQPKIQSTNITAPSVNYGSSVSKNSRRQAVTPGAKRKDAWNVVALLFSFLTLNTVCHELLVHDALTVGEKSVRLGLCGRTSTNNLASG